RRVVPESRGPVLVAEEPAHSPGRARRSPVRLRRRPRGISAAIEREYACELMRRTVSLAPGLPEVCRFGLATRGNTHLKTEDVEHAIGRGLNYLNWCGHSDGLSRAVARLGQERRSRIVVAAQFEARSARDA